jgi:hypothetical protein
LSLDEMLEVVRGRTLARGGDVAAHIDQCAACGAARSWLERVMQAAAAGPLEEPPASVTERALQVFPREQSRPRQARSWSLARLVHDTLGAPVPAGVRGRGIGRRLLYDAGWAQLDIEIREARLNPEALQVRGQLLPIGPMPQELNAFLSSEGAVVAQAAADASGIFVLPEVRSGTYRLDVGPLASDEGVRVEPFELALEGS